MSSREGVAQADAENDSYLVYLPELYLRETYDLLLTRWEKLYKDFYNKDTDHYDLSKVPDIYDMARYDLLHNDSDLLPSLGALFDKSRLFSLAVVPQEYGVGVEMQRYLGAKMCSAFLSKVKKDINIAMADESHADMAYLLDSSHAEDLNIRTLGRSIRTRLYFTSESHLHTLLNVLRYALPGQSSMISEAGLRILGSAEELSYLTHIVFRMFEKKGASENDPKRFRLEICFCPGADSDPRSDKSSNLAPTVLLNSNLPCGDFINGLDAALELSNSEIGDYIPDKTTDSSDVKNVTPVKEKKAKSMYVSPGDCSDEWETDAQERPRIKVPCKPPLRP